MFARGNPQIFQCKPQDRWLGLIPLTKAVNSTCLPTAGWGLVRVWPLYIYPGVALFLDWDYVFHDYVKALMFFDDIVHLIMCIVRTYFMSHKMLLIFTMFRRYAALQDSHHHLFL